MTPPKQWHPRVALWPVQQCALTDHFSTRLLIVVPELFFPAAGAEHFTDPTNGATYIVRWGQDEDGRLVAIEAQLVGYAAPNAIAPAPGHPVYGGQPRGEGVMRLESFSDSFVAAEKVRN